MSDTAQARGIAISIVAFDTNATLSPAYEQGRCEAWSSDVTVLSGFRRLLSNSSDHVILPDLITTEPLGPVVLVDDSQWSQAVEWSVMVTVQAWEVGIDSANVTTYSGSDLTAQRITGQLPFDPGFGLQPEYARTFAKRSGGQRWAHGGGAVALALVVRRHPQVIRVLSGHVHRLIQTNWGSCALWVCPSTSVAVAPDLDPRHDPAETAEGPMISLHAFTGRGIVSHLVPVGPASARSLIGSNAPDFITYIRGVQASRAGLFGS